MIKALTAIFRKKSAPLPPPSLPEGERVYAVGDVHGRLDLFQALVAAIEADDAVRAPARTTIILLGDLVDRGPDSAGVLAAARALASRRRVRVLMGNHEEMFLDSFEDADILRQFLKFGGRETILSYPGVALAAYREMTVDETQALMHAVVPEADIAFMRGFEEHIVMGDYLFVHAGVRPDLPFEEQKPREMRWIREPFLRHTGAFPGFVVHGHSIFAEVDVQTNRIGLDTGAYQSGRLTAMGLEGTGRWLIEAAEFEGQVGTRSLPLAG